MAPTKSNSLPHKTDGLSLARNCAIPADRSLFLTRSFFRSSWAHLRWNLRTGLQMSVSGMFNIGHDVGGFAGDPPDPELLVRWVQMGALHPRCVTNSWKADGTVTTPWMHPAVTAHARAALRLRYRLMPYTYTLYWRAAVDNEPILRPTFVEFEDDENTFDDCDEMMLGGAILAAPVVERGATTRKVYLPRIGSGSDGLVSGDGTRASDSSLGWYDFYGEEWLAGGQVVTLDAPLEKLPLLVAEGSMVPMTGEAHNFERLHDEPSRCVRVFPFRGVGKATGQLYEDDGLGWGFRNGGYRWLTFEMETNEEEVRISVATEGSYKLPYEEIVFAMPASEKRPLKLSARSESGPRLLTGNFQWHE